MSYARAMLVLNDVVRANRLSHMKPHERRLAELAEEQAER